jgi:hypothetical protein
VRQHGAENGFQTTPAPEKIVFGSFESASLFDMRSREKFSRNYPRIFTVGYKVMGTFKANGDLSINSAEIVGAVIELDSTKSSHR